ncbi:MAG: phosphoribosyl-AMP cyclohydrolase, partial [Pseudomonadota bacterium]
LAHMNEEALGLTISTREGHFWSRSRQEIWHKGATSGNVLHVQDIRIDCDQDAVWLIVKVQGDGAACHTGRRSCFYRSIESTGTDTELKMVDDE